MGKSPWTVSGRLFWSLKALVGICAVIAPFVLREHLAIPILIGLVLLSLSMELIFKTHRDVRLDEIPNHKFLTQAEYDALEVKDEKTLYFTRRN